MGASGSRGPGPDAISLPQQQIISGRAAGAAKLAAAAVNAKKTHSTTDSGTKMPLVWDKASVRMERVGRPSAGTFRLSVEFSSEAPCTLQVNVHCREAQEGAFIAFHQVDLEGPRPFARRFEAGKHMVHLDGADAIDLVRFPLTRYWKYAQKQRDVVPIALSLKSEERGGAQSILHFGLVVSKEESVATCRLQFLRQKVLVQGKEYKLEEIYGIAELGKDHAHGDSEAEPCVICLSESRTTALLPCRHMCVCESCAVQLKLRKQACPICRREVQDLQVFEVQKPAAPAETTWKPAEPAAQPATRPAVQASAWQHGRRPSRPV